MGHQPQPIPGAMTLGELRRLLSEIPASMDDYVIVAPSDDEGNGFYLVGAPIVGWLRSHDENSFCGGSPEDGESWDDAMQRATKQHTANEESEDPDSDFELDEHDHPAICLG